MVAMPIHFVYGKNLQKSSSPEPSKPCGLIFAQIIGDGKHILDISCLSNFHKISNGAFCQKGIDYLFEWFRPIEQDGCHAHTW